MGAVLTIAQIEVAGPDGKARRLLLDDQQVRTTAGAVVRYLRLEPPCTVCSDALHAAELECAKERSLRLLGYRERSPRELLDRLRLDGYPQPVCEAVVERFSELDLVDESRFAELLVRTKVAAGWGRRRVVQELRRKGVSEHVANALTEALRTTDFDRAKAALRPGDTANRAAREKAWRRLTAKGFDSEVVSAALNGGELDL